MNKTVTQEWIVKFRYAIDNFKSSLDPLIVKAQLDGLISMLEDLEEQLRAEEDTEEQPKP